MFSDLFFLALMSHFAIVQCIPLGILGPQNASPEQHKAIKQAAGDGCTESRPGCFPPASPERIRPNYNLNQIQQNVQTLKNGKIKVQNAEHFNSVTELPFLGQGVTIPKTGIVSFGAAFHSSNLHTQGGTVIHEATHTLLDTKDNWVPVPPHSNQHLPPHLNQHVPPYHPVLEQTGLNGYIDSPDFQHLKDTNSHNMHMNADSYRMLAHTCTLGLHAPFRRRALAESDPVKREYLICRAAESCVRSKVAAAKAKQDSKSHADQRNAGKKFVGAKKGPVGGKHQVNVRKGSRMQGKVPTITHRKVRAPKQAGGKKTTSHAVARSGRPSRDMY
ncbi:hypothetical protein BDZ97DRAFT_1756937 [Flammula alnicola]|nr:hypothetical protein BDZ97DRAFT_1756937 [Flammula alnicola]